MLSRWRDSDGDNTIEQSDAGISLQEESNLNGCLCSTGTGDRQTDCAQVPRAAGAVE